MTRYGDDPGPEIGQTGARFGGGARRRRRRLPPAFEPVQDAAPESAGVGTTGARFNGAARSRAPVAQPPVAQPPVAQPPVAQPPVIEPAAPSAVRPEPEPDRAVWSSGPAVRPYVLTGGRTRGGFALEALVSATPGPPRAGEPPEHTGIRELCREPRSVAEVAALVGMPLGVVRILLGDLHAAGAVVVHGTADADGPDLAVLERVLAGLRRL